MKTKYFLMLITAFTVIVAWYIGFYLGMDYIPKPLREGFTKIRKFVLPDNPYVKEYHWSEDGSK